MIFIIETSLYKYVLPYLHSILATKHRYYTSLSPLVYVDDQFGSVVSDLLAFAEVVVLWNQKEVVAVGFHIHQQTVAHTGNKKHLIAQGLLQEFRNVVCLEVFLFRTFKRHFNYIPVFSTKVKVFPFLNIAAAWNLIFIIR